MATEALTGRVLCIDDDVRMRRAVANSLMALGVTVVEASGEADAIERAAEGTFDLVLCDYVLEGTDGLDLIGNLKPKLPNAVYALMTGVTDINLLSGAINSRTISFFILKPWHAEELREIVRTAISMQKTPASIPQASVVVSSQYRTVKTRRAPLIVIGAAVGMLVASGVALILGQRVARRDAAFLAQRAADVALAAPQAAVSQLAGRGITYVTVSGNDGALVAFAVDRESAQVPGSDRDAALALREVGPTPRLIVAESRNDTMIAEAGVAADAFADSVAELRYMLITATVLAVLAGAAAAFIR